MKSFISLCFCRTTVPQSMALLRCCPVITSSPTRSSRSTFFRLPTCLYTRDTCKCGEKLLLDKGFHSPKKALWIPFDSHDAVLKGDRRHFLFVIWSTGDGLFFPNWAAFLHFIVAGRRFKLSRNQQMKYFQYFTWYTIILNVLRTS